MHTEVAIPLPSFAATLAASGRDEFVLEYVGLVRLAKGFGESRVYRVASG